MPSRVTLNDVAREAGVSLATASRAINGNKNRKVREDIRERVLAAATRLHYTPDATAQAMARGATTTLGLVVHSITDPYFSAIASGVMVAAERRGLVVTLASTQSNANREVELVELLHSQRARSVIVVGGRRDDDVALAAMTDVLGRFRRAGNSTVLVGQPLLGTDTVTIDNTGPATQLARDLHGRGYQDVVVLAGPADHLTARERAGAFADAFRELGGTVDVAHSRFTRDGGHHAVRTVLRRYRPELVFAVNDVMALGALAGLTEAGLSVPHDVGLAGFDDIDGLQDVTPHLTTVHLPLHDIGIAATDLAFAAPAPDPRVVRVSGTVALRASTPGPRRAV
ncbi:LacI family DNA-binding transcriptional regulator [Sanguibacter suaedae]|uniref:LacI family DNA-binding transcriptional regulator n=1 Tax=Sanguibacter suaedae TaxID=2795737 RepID=A0A934MA57_9MICO|nr:LacI family DNA-binding transcriptional regulator [Sanguibacter suaedae]MBI9113891.1 LacI family DNA-binding transcriptional regulator [Sanguibacter suaedae]